MKSACKERERERVLRVNLFKTSGLILLCISAIALSSCRQTFIPIPPFWEDDGETIVPGEWDEYFQKGNGSENNPYIISDQDGINQIAALVNDGTTTFEGVVFQVNNPITLTNHTPIGTKGSQAFQGKFRGPSPENKARISIEYSGSEYNFAGIFGGLGDGALIENLEVEGNVNNTANGVIDENTPSAGLIAGTMSTGAIIQNCISRGSVQSMRAGGIAGELEGGSILYCDNYANVTSETYAGGITGSSDSFLSPEITKARIEESNNYGTISSNTGTNAGGIIGSAENGIYIFKCNNEGDVKGKSRIGGIAGTVLDKGTRIVSCENSGSLSFMENATSSDTGRIGGIAGYVHTNASIENCINSSSISFTEGKHIGGIVGLLTTESEISGAINKGDITGKEYTGGIVGEAQYDVLIDGTENEVSNSGIVTGYGTYIGGIAGRLFESYIDASRNTGNVIGNTGASSIGGIVGIAQNSSEIRNSWNESNVTLNDSSKTSAGGIVGYLSSSSIIEGGSSGEISATKQYAAGIAGRIEGTAVRILDVTISGSITSANYAGGVAGYLNSDIELSNINIINSESISGERTAGVIAGLTATGKTITFKDCNIDSTLLDKTTENTWTLIGSGTVNTIYNNTVANP